MTVQNTTASHPRPGGIAATWRRLNRPRGLSRNTLTAIVFVGPAIALFVIFVVLPMAEAFTFSFYRWSGYGELGDWVGLANFDRMFGHPVFDRALLNNFLIILISLSVSLPLAFMLAVLLADRFPTVSVFRAIFFIPYILADVAAGLIWRYLYDGQYGIVAATAQAFGAEAPYVLADRDLAIYAVLLVVVWKYFGLHMIIYIAGLQSIPREVREAAFCDGAGWWTTLRHVTIPMTGPTIRLTVFFSILGSLQLFDLIIPLTGGGPQNSTHTLVTYLYTFGIVRLNIGFGSAVGVVLFLISIVFAFSYRRILMRND
ncbi:carbohydrate ABC transporter permease [Bauldia sp.]|uniref:carbohydrate ABC transporter permease n=1 Tax=Bauldia sp. TaxID=2575872 RepID=UPI003BA8F203